MPATGMDGMQTLVFKRKNADMQKLLAIILAGILTLLLIWFIWRLRSAL